ncbi:hypothetical protein EDD15DRAFT_2369544 [Pisolithus albus]|nr:hypothetical protein EDD15DRAFT_2369544 [Pisolithus albus]
MPTQLKNKPLQSFLAAFDGVPMLDNWDTVNEEHQAFPCVHYAIHNCYGVSGVDAPTGYHPHYLQLKENKPITLRWCPLCQMRHFSMRRGIISEVVFEYVETLQQSYLPQEYDILMELTDAILKGYQAQP